MRKDWVRLTSCRALICFRAVTSSTVRGKLVDVKMFGMFGGFGLGGGTFDSNYRAYPVSFIDKNDAEHADKVFLPPSALDRLGMQLLYALDRRPSTCRLSWFWGAASLHIEYPMLFKVENRRTGRSTHCGVLEFIADEGHVYLPYWVRAPFYPRKLSCLSKSRSCSCLLLSCR